MKFHEKLQKLRKEKGITQEALAEMLDVSRQAVSKWESGASYPEMDKMIALSEIFGLTIDGLVKDGEPVGDDHNAYSAPFWMRYGMHYEYKSKRTLFGLPLVHIHIGRGFRRAKGIIAIGNIATGLISLGIVSLGLLSFGVISAGLIGLGAFSLGLMLSAGAISIGFFAVGAVAIGVISIGAVSVGMYSIGALSVASRVAVGAHAYGHIAVGRVVRGVSTFIDTSANRDFSTIPMAEVRDAINTEFPGTWNWLIWLLTSFGA